MLTCPSLTLQPKHHFAPVVPLRTWTCPPLLNAIFTASARRLSRPSECKVRQGINFLDNLLPGLETAIHYHERTITHLIQLCSDADQVHDDKLVAAASI